jgi:hypothetical protein
MATYPHPYYTESTQSARWLMTGFIAGALAVLVFHQSAFAALHDLGLTTRAPFSMEATAPWGIPQLWSLAFWGGVWGAILALVLRRLDGPRLVILATVFGAVACSLVAWFVAAPLKGQPIAGGFKLSGMAVGLIVNAAWGLGTGIGLLLFGRPHHASGDRRRSMRLR